jgi:hypothetical protein
MMTGCQGDNPGTGLNLEAEMNIEQKQSFISLAEREKKNFIWHSQLDA